ncbi:MAG: outer membrane protein assembly factor BamD [Deltaproteobacteria bacterium]|nr:outer membrane protein assembly factor BamD [Deltaproteobacteria bacterium]
MIPSRSFRVFTIFCAVLLLAGFSAYGCAGKKGSKAPERNAEELAQEGMAAYNKGDYPKAIKNFEMLRDWYPFSKFLILAELKLPDSRFKLGEYEEAAAGYENFEKMHPANEATPYVIYQLGMCHYERLSAPDRDQTSAVMALSAFDRLISGYPDSPYAKKASEPVRMCQMRLAEHELSIGRYYLRQKNYAAAKARFENVITRYPDTGVHREALELLAEIRPHIKEAAKPKEPEAPKPTEPVAPATPEIP